MGSSRRELLQWVSWLGSGWLLERAITAPAAALAPPLDACRPVGDPLLALQQGNARFAAAWQLAATQHEPGQRMAVLQQVLGEHCQVDPMALAAAQHPWAAVLTCADSRIPLEWIFCVGAGELFGVRSAGNTAFDAGIASLEYAVEQLGVPLILVMGHSGCGAVSAALSDQPLSPLQEQLVEPIRACLQPGDDLSRAVRRNACSTAQRLTTGSDLLRQAQASGRVQIASGCFDLATGHMELL
jgi:carbonic anhydrase